MSEQDTRQSVFKVEKNKRVKLEATAKTVNFYPHSGNPGGFIKDYGKSKTDDWACLPAG